jgi:hypothetical protein
MKKVFRVVFALLPLSSGMFAEAQTAIDVCNAMAQNALHNITISQTNDAAVAALFSNYCYADGSTNSGAINAWGNVVVDGLPIGAAFKGQSASSRFTQFCSQYQSSSAVSNNQYNYSNLVFGKALDSVNECIKAAGSNFTLSYKTLTPSTLVINFSIPAGQSLTINGVNPDKGVTCTGHDFNGAGGTITYSQSTQQTIGSGAANAAITCSRDPSGTNNGQQFYPDKAIVVTTNVNNLDIFWPQDSSFPIVTASTIQQNINALQASLAAVKQEADLSILPIGTMLPWTGNGNPPTGWVLCDGSNAQCANFSNLFLRGSGQTGVGQIGGNDTHSHGAGAYAPGTTNKSGDGGGFNAGGTNFHVYVSDGPNVPRYVAVRYIMKVS